MHKKIFKQNFLTSLFVLLLSLALVSGMLFRHFEAQTFGELESEAGYLAYALENEGPAFLENFSGDDKRITLVSPDGTVLADTSADAASLENHGDRAEIRAALKDGSGTSTRYSDTRMEKTLYYAERLPDGRVLRVSATQASVLRILFGLLQPLLLIIFIALFVSFFLSKRVSRAIVRPINALDLENPAENVTYEELTPLLRKLAAQKQTIDRQIREARRRQEEFKLITENMREGLLVIDKNAAVLSYNRAAMQLLQIAPGQTGSVLQLNRAGGFRRVVEAALGGVQAEDRITAEDRICTLIAGPVLEAGKIIGAVIVVLDVTESARREQLRREFTANVSHELKTPLTSISGFAEMMRAGDTPPETVAEFSGAIYEEARRMINLVEDIMKISELDEQPAAKDAAVDLYALCADVAARLRPVAEKRGVQISVSGETAAVCGTEKILGEMVYNLCDNAIKYNKENGTVNMHVEKDGSRVRLTVRDTGIGIPPAEQARVFERFYRVDKSHSKKVGGTGLGLAIVKHAAAFHHAEITLESTVGEGTAVTVLFPPAAD